MVFTGLGFELKKRLPHFPPMPPGYAIHREWISFHTQLRTSGTMLRVFSLWVAHYKRYSWRHMDIIGKNVFLAQRRALTTLNVQFAGPPRDFAITCATRSKIRHAYYTHLALAPFVSFHTGNNTTPCLPSTHGQRPGGAHGGIFLV